MTTTIKGPKTWSMVRDAEGHREYSLTYHVDSNDPNDGPGRALLTPGLPLPGAYWIIGNEVDLWAWCRWDAKVQQFADPQSNNTWLLEFKFGTKPPDLKKCKDSQWDDPLLEPARISGGCKKGYEEIQFDRFGVEVVNSAWEVIRGKQVEFEYSTPNVTIEQNVAVLNAPLVNSMVDTVNDSFLWGFPPRAVRLADWTWEPKYYGTCHKYYTRRLMFETRYRLKSNGQIESWDRDIMDEGTSVLNGRWLPDRPVWQIKPVGFSYLAGTGGERIPEYPDPTNPSHFIRYQDRNGNPKKVILNGLGLPADFNYTVGTGTGTWAGGPGNVHVEHYPESNFLLLPGGIPLDF